MLSSPPGSKKTIPHANGALSWRLVRADGRVEEVVAFEEAVVTFFLEAAGVLGVPNSLAAIYGICFASAKPLTYSEVRERLSISAGSISQGLRVLRDVGALKVVTLPSDRREFFTPELELRKLVAHYLEQRVAKQLDSGRARLQAISRAIPRDAVEAKVLKERMRSLQTWHRKSSALLPIAKTFLRLG